ncbi:hypothetical protein TspCOW1_01960 [Thiohalobacter sp. COW1]|uniref:DUF6362 family protein n=1 Tax=Thiohalobacter sp. COW1 TaxID=2795687 RepID=UPI001916255B|nr:DUF6362 family protein [Thiohalobacter sp. COW1]BCO30093.1 hypothetical protein TspCOW1_01960 [Thiohalobacter sp. COW1]
MAEWTIEQVAERFNEAAQTAHRLPAVRVQGYFNTWPAILRQPWETFAGEDGEYRLPPDPTAIDRMEETMGWVLWLGEEDRHLVWMRADGYRWRDICRRFGCDRTTAWRRWQRALLTVAMQLNATSKPIKASEIA